MSSGNCRAWFPRFLTLCACRSRRPHALEHWLALLRLRADRDDALPVGLKRLIGRALCPRGASAYRWVSATAQLLAFAIAATMTNPAELADGAPRRLTVPA